MIFPGHIMVSAMSGAKYNRSKYFRNGQRSLKDLQLEPITITVRIHRRRLVWRSFPRFVTQEKANATSDEVSYLHYKTRFLSSLQWILPLVNAHLALQQRSFHLLSHCKILLQIIRQFMLPRLTIHLSRMPITPLRTQTAVS
jgi:hypothetical protein